MFEHEDAIGIGILLAMLFECYYIPFNNIGGRTPSLTDRELIGTGRGGDINANGDYGKPLISGNSAGKLATGEDSNLAGGPGTLWGGGYGLISGKFGFGGHGTTYLSSGGGGGWYGGGSSIINAGGGGGSSFCLEADRLGEPDYTHCPAGYSLPLRPDKTGPDKTFLGQWLDRGVLNGAGPNYYERFYKDFEDAELSDYYRQLMNSGRLPTQEGIQNAKNRARRWFELWRERVYGEDVNGFCVITLLYNGYVEKPPYIANKYITEDEFYRVIDTRGDFDILLKVYDRYYGNNLITEEKLNQFLSSTKYNVRIPILREALDNFFVDFDYVRYHHLYAHAIHAAEASVFKHDLGLIALYVENIVLMPQIYFVQYVFEYTGKVQLYETEMEGIYIIDCFGAPGGDALFGIDEFMGGAGGYCSGRFGFREGTPLYIYVGQRGGGNNSPVYTWNGGGGKAGFCTSGGGATDVRWDGEEGSTDWQSTLYSRFIVAGGGGGVQTYPNGQYPEPPFDIPIPGGNNADREKEKTVHSGENWFLISDKSIVYVDVEYSTTLELPDDNKLDAKLFIDGKYIDVKGTKLREGRGYNRFVFNLSDYLEQDTTPYWAKLEAELNYHPKIYLTGRGLRITVETRKDSAGNSDNVIDVKHFMERHKKTTTSLMAMKMLIREAIKAMNLGNVHLSTSGLLGFREIIQRVIKEFELTNVQLKTTSLIGALSYINERLETFDLRNSELKTTSLIGALSYINERLETFDLRNSKLKSDGLLGAKIILREFIETVLIGLRSSYTALLGARIKLVDTSEPTEPIGDETLSITETDIDTFETFYNIIKDSDLIETEDYIIDTLDKRYGIIKDSDMIETVDYVIDTLDKRYGIIKDSNLIETEIEILDKLDKRYGIIKDSNLIETEIEILD